MDRADIVTMANEVREAFLAVGDGISEKRTVIGEAFFVGGHAVGQVERKPNSVRVRLWLAEKERKALERRPTFDADSGWLHVVSDDDIVFIRTLIPLAHKAAMNGTATATSAPAAAARPTLGPATTALRPPLKRTISRPKREP